MMSPTVALGIAFMVLVALLAAVAAGLLSRQAGAHWANAVLRAAAAFGGTLTLELLLMKLVGL